MISSFANAAGDTSANLQNYGDMKAAQEFELARNVYKEFIKASGLVNIREGMGDVEK